MSPPPPRVSLVVKGNKKGSHAEAVDGESSRLAASGWRKGLGTAASSAAASALGFWGALWGFGKQGGQHSFHATAFGSFGRGWGALLTRACCWLEQPSHQTFCSLPCACWRKCCILQNFSPLPCLLCCSFLWAFLKVNQGENCSQSCLEATRG